MMSRSGIPKLIPVRTGIRPTFQIATLRYSICRIRMT